MSKTLSLGAWESDRAEIQTAGTPDRGDVSDLPPLAQFPVHVTRLVRKRELNSTAESTGAAGFVLVDPDDYIKLKTSGKEEPLIHTGCRRLTNRIHFVTAVATRSIVQEVNGDDCDLFQRLEALGAAHKPTLIYLPDQGGSKLFFYPNGTGCDDGIVEMQVSGKSVSAQEIESAISTVHEQELVTPDNVGPSKIWNDAQKKQPSKEAERRVQQLIRIGLAVKFAPFSVRQEQSGKIGRTDLEIVDDRTGTPGQVTHHATLELKVLRSRGQTGKPVTDTDTRTHIEEGVDQADQYGKDKNSILKMLCCFDMRDKDFGDAETFSHVATKAAQLDVLLRRWFLYHDSQSYRAAKTALSIPN